MWWYEESNGIEIYVHRDAIPETGTAIVVIPWSQVRRSLARKDRELKR